MNVLKDGWLVLSNNFAERGIKTLVIGRNYLFSTSLKGALYINDFLSLVETEKTSGLDSRKYLEYLLTNLLNCQNAPLDAYLS